MIYHQTVCGCFMCYGLQLIYCCASCLNVSTFFMLYALLLSFEPIQRLLYFCVTEKSCGYQLQNLLQIYFTWMKGISKITLFFILMKNMLLFNCFLEYLQ